MGQGADRPTAVLDRMWAADHAFLVQPPPGKSPVPSDPGHAGPVHLQPTDHWCIFRVPGDGTWSRLGRDTDRGACQAVADDAGQLGCMDPCPGAEYDRRSAEISGVCG